MIANDVHPVVANAEYLQAALNRLVFTDIESARYLWGGAGHAVRGATLPTTTLKAVAAASLDRTVAELSRAGLKRIARTADAEVWALPTGARLLVQASAEARDPVDAMVREYATLLTQTVTLAPSVSIRVCAPATLLALWWREHRGGREAFTQCPIVEDIVELVARYPELPQDVASLPQEIRAIAAESARCLVNDASCEWVVGRALADSRTTPSVSEAIVGTFRQLAASA